MVRDSEPSTDLGFTEAGILLVPYPIIEAEVEVLSDIDRFTCNFLKWATAIKTSRTVRCAVLDLAHPSESIVPQPLRHLLLHHDSKPLLSNFANNAFSKVVIGSFRFCNFIIYGILPNVSCMNCRSPSPARDFDSIGYAATNKSFVAKICA
jgi:hypothetical protein